MSVAVQVLDGQYREELGKGPSREIRRQGMVPAVIYGKNKENVHIALDSKEINTRYNKVGFTSQLFNIKVGKEAFLAIPFEIHTHPVTDNVEHVDFIHVDENSEVKVHVKLHFINSDKCIGIKRGGVINIARREVELVCKPQNIPTVVDIDLLNVDINHSVHINDIELPEGVKFAGSENITLAAVVGRGDDKEETATATATA
ncbi:MAG: 50S ribosomal protein L25/general stress protein Ctc [Alphaproteobacteria bacterium]|nr:50S ribosomal protein L25/general stress protein Ctc [Alphaproteobacteria bacterium]OJV15782.1 MAG: 50S ribosomal protein L25/general stress protein Ctc [Alphaproteobacteria bacterium 33-17]